MRTTCKSNLSLHDCGLLSWTGVQLWHRMAAPVPDIRSQRRSEAQRATRSRALSPLLYWLPWRRRRRQRRQCPYLDPKPRDFTVATFKCRSTPTGTLPVDSDLIHSLERGLRGSNMPSWLPLTVEDRVGPGRLHQDLLAEMEKGKAWNAHSDSARAGSHRREDEGRSGTIQEDGMLEVPRRSRPRQRAFGLDAYRRQGTANSPYDFSTGHKFKCGITDQDLYQIFMTGLDGTPMPSFADNINPDQAWDLVFYLRTFQPMKSKEKAIAKQLGLKPIDPSAPNAPAAPAQPNQ